MNDGKRDEVIEEVKNIFISYSVQNGLRKTPERFAILEEIYKLDNHFDAEELYDHMKNRNYRVSRATVYNTLEVLVAANLVTKHQFGKNLAQYERAYSCRQHDHVICTDCGKVLEFCDPRIQQIKNMIGEMMNFDIQYHSLNLFGNCKNNPCERKKVKK